MEFMKQTKRTVSDRAWRHILVAAAVLAILTLAAVVAHGAIPGTRTLKGAAIALAVSEFGGQLDSLINTALANNKMPPGAATKVVPVVSLGGGKYIGAAQVIGPADQVRQVSVCVQIEASFLRTKFRTKIVVPVDSADSLNRIEGVGVSAVIDVRI